MQENIGDCIIYKSWPSRLTGYPTILDCKPKPTLDPENTMEYLSSLYTLVTALTLTRETIPEPNPEPPELIGGRFNVYKYTSRKQESKDILLELRVVVDTLENRIIWMGGVYKGQIPGVLDKPPLEPELSKPPVEKLTPPPAPEGQKIIRKPVPYTAEGPGGWMSRLDSSVGLGYYNSVGPWEVARYTSSGDRLGEYRFPFHCVTGWSVYGIRWEGIPLVRVLDEYGLLSNGRWLLAVSRGGYASIMPLEEELLEDAIIAYRMNGESIPLEHGGPVRLIVPRLYGWKSVKWLGGLYVGDVYLDGYWEARGYHPRGLVGLGERFKGVLIS